jgi:hypothetical protein
MGPWCSDCMGSNRRCSEPSSSMSRSPPIDLPHTSRKIGTHRTIKWYQIFGFLWGILVCLFVYLLFSYQDPPKKPKNHIFRCPITLRAQIFVLVTLLSLCPSWLSLVAGQIRVLSFSILLRALLVQLSDSTFPNSKLIQHINRFAFASRLAWTLASPTLDSLWNPIWALPSVGSTFAIINCKFLPHPISIPSHIPPSRTVTQTCFGKTVITFAYKIRLSYFLKKLGRIKFRIQSNPTLVRFAHGKRPKFDF